MPMFCRVGGCFFATFDSKAMIAHAIAEHSDVYLKSKELTNKYFLNSGTPLLFLENRVSRSTNDLSLSYSFEPLSAIEC